MDAGVEKAAMGLGAAVADAQRTAEQFAEAVDLMRRLRGPDGCPWDREQTLETIRRYTVEEVYEVIDAIDRASWPDLREELGDLLLQILFYAQIAADERQFDIADVLENLTRKLVRRHPHVFGDGASAAAGNAAVLPGAPAGTPTEVLRNWEAIKTAEKAARGEQSLLDSVPRTFPALLEAAKLGSKAAKFGFDWPDYRGVMRKLQEEIAEVEQILPSGNPHDMQEEIGDLLFTAANLARHLKVDPEIALRAANAKFRARFSHMEHASPDWHESLTAAELESLWEKAKAAERTPVSK